MSRTEGNGANPASETPSASRGGSKSPKARVLDAIIDVAPDLSPDELADELDLHYDLGLDSIDLLNVASAIAERTGVEIPERAAATLRCVGDLIEFVTDHRRDDG